MKGLTVDCGASYFLTHAIPRKGFGAFLALTGATVDGVDALNAGIATHAVT